MIIESKSAYIILFAFVVTFAQGDGEIIQPRIHSGKPADGRFRFVVLVRTYIKWKNPERRIRTDTYFCSGFLLTPRTIVTAAHCLPTALIHTLLDKKTKYKVVTFKALFEGGLQTYSIAAEDPLQQNRGPDMTVSRRVTYPKEVDCFIYKNDSTPIINLHGPLINQTYMQMKNFVYDMALYRLKGNPFVLGDTVGTVAFMDPLRGGLMSKEWFPYECYAMGYGKQERGRKQWDGKLYYLPLEAGGSRACETMNMRSFTEKICARGKNSLGSLCGGDSGGPIVCKVKPNEYAALGVASMSVGHELSVCKHRTADEQIRTSYEILSSEFIKGVEPDAVEVTSGGMFRLVQRDPGTGASGTGTTGAKSNTPRSPPSYGVLIVCVVFLSFDIFWLC